MKSFMMALKSKEGKSSLIGMAVGIIAATVGGYIFEDRVVLCDFVVLASAIFSMVGAERFCRLIIMYREELGED